MALTQVTARSQITVVDFIDWNTKFGDTDPFALKTEGWTEGVLDGGEVGIFNGLVTVCTTNLGVAFELARVAGASSFWFHSEQRLPPPTVDWAGTFEEGMGVLARQSSPSDSVDPIVTCTFASAVAGVVFSFNRDLTTTLPVTYHAVLELFDGPGATGTLLGTFTSDDYTQTTRLPDPLTPVVGAAYADTDPPLIRSFRVVVTDGTHRDFGIDRVDIGATPSSTPPPGIPGVPLGECGPALFSGTCLIACPADVLPRPTLIPTSDTLVIGVPFPREPSA
jgi:hypothetical protein